MARPKRYPTAAARQAAYRHRLAATTCVVDRQALAQLHAHLDALHTAVAAAARAGDPCAQQVYHAGVDTTLQALTAWFTRQAAPRTNADAALPPR